METWRTPILRLSLITGATLALGAPLAKAELPLQGSAGPSTTVTTEILKPEERNGDYLNQVTVPAFARQPEANYNTFIFDKSIADEMTNKYNGYADPFARRQAYQLNGMHDELQFQQSSKDLADWTLQKLMQYHLDHTVKDGIETSAKEQAAAKPSPNNPSARAEQQNAQAVATISQVNKVFKGTSFNLGADTKTKFRYDLPGRGANWGLTSPIADADIQYKSRLGSKSIGSVQEPEHFTANLSRNFTPIGASTGVHYGLMSETLNYGLRKDLYGPLSAGVDRSNHFREPNRNETVVHMNFGVNF